MAGTNPTQQLSKAVSDIDFVQFSIAEMEARMDAAILAESDEDISVLRLLLTQLKAALGMLRSTEAFWRGEVNSEKEARRSQADIARA